MKQELNNIAFRRGQVYIADLGDDVIGSEQAGVRPVVILQNNIGNKNSPNLICLAITSNTSKKSLPTHVGLSKEEYEGLSHDSIVLADQIRTISKKRVLFDKPLTEVKKMHMKSIEKSLTISLGFGWE